MAQLDPSKLNDIFNLDSDTSILQPEEEQSSDEVELDKAKVYSELATLVKNGNDVLSTVKMMIEADPDAEMVHGAAQMLNAIRDTLKEFTKIHMSKLKFEQQKELENLKIQGRKELTEHKFDKAKELLTQKNPKQVGYDPNTTEDLLPFCQEKVIEAIVQEEKKQQKTE
jgi:hypothetical protein